MLVQLQEEALAAPEGAFTERQVALLCEQLAKADKCLTDGADEFLQLLHVGAQVQQAMLTA